MFSIAPPKCVLFQVLGSRDWEQQFLIREDLISSYNCRQLWLFGHASVVSAFAGACWVHARAGWDHGHAEAMFLTLIKMCTCLQFWLLGHARAVPSHAGATPRHAASRALACCVSAIAGAGPGRAGAVPWHAGTMLCHARAMLLTFTRFKGAWPFWGSHQDVLESCWTMLGSRL